MRSRCEGGGGERELLGGIEDEGEVKRVVYRATAPKRVYYNYKPVTITGYWSLFVSAR